MWIRRFLGGRFGIIFIVCTELCMTITIMVRLINCWRGI